MYVSSVRCVLVSCWSLWSLPSGLLHSKTAVFWSISPPGDLSQCEPGQSNNPWVLQCFCLSPGWSAGGGWSPSSARPHSPLPRSPWCWSACASPGRWEASPCCLRGRWGFRAVVPGWKWSWERRWRQFFMQQSPPSAAFHWCAQGEGVSPAELQEKLHRETTEWKLKGNPTKFPQQSGVLLHVWKSVMTQVHSGKIFLSIIYAKFHIRRSVNYIYSNYFSFISFSWHV